MKREENFRPDRVLSYFKVEWLPLTFVTVSGLVYNIGLLATPWFEGRLAQCLADILGGSQTTARMAMLVLAYILVTLLVQAARFIKRFYVRRFANNINRRMKGILYANLVRQSRAALEQQGAGELMTKAISDVDDCVEGMRKFTTEIFDTGVALAGYAVMLLVYDWRLALLSLLFTPLSYVCAAWMKKPVQRAGAAYKKAAGALSAATLDRAQNAVTYRIYGCEDARVENYEQALTAYEKTAVRNNVWQSALPPLYLAASEAGVLFILWFGAKNVLGTGWSAWDIAAFTTFLSCFTKLVVKSSKVAKLFNAVQKAEVSWKRIRPLMKSPEQLEPLQVPAPQTVTLQDLSFAYGGEPVFAGLSLTARPGDLIGITGPVACGKSTLGRVFLCEASYGGSAKFGGKEFSALTRARSLPRWATWATTRSSAPTPCRTMCSAAVSRMPCRGFPLQRWTAKCGPWKTASIPSSAPAAPAFPAGRPSVWRWPARWHIRARCWYWMTRSLHWTAIPRIRCLRTCRTTRRIRSCSSSRTGCITSRGCSRSSLWTAAGPLLAPTAN